MKNFIKVIKFESLKEKKDFAFPEIGMDDLAYCQFFKSTLSHIILQGKIISTLVMGDCHHGQGNNLDTIDFVFQGLCEVAQLTFKLLAICQVVHTCFR